MIEKELALMSTDASLHTTAGDAIARRRTGRAGAALGAAAAAAVVWVVAVPVLGIDLAVSPGGQPQSVSLGAVVATSSVAGLLGWALLAALETRTRRAVTVWSMIAVTVALLSLGGPLSAGASGAATAALVALHVVVAAVLIPGLRRTSPSR
jgi:hypothetical protein